MSTFVRADREDISLYNERLPARANRIWQHSEGRKRGKTRKWERGWENHPFPSPRTNLHWPNNQKLIKTVSILIARCDERFGHTRVHISFFFFFNFFPRQNHDSPLRSNSILRRPFLPQINIGTATLYKTMKYSSYNQKINNYKLHVNNTAQHCTETTFQKRTFSARSNSFKSRKKSYIIHIRNITCIISSN